jgi:hypothetical protein
VQRSRPPQENSIHASLERCQFQLTLRQAIALKPDYAEAFSYRGNTLHEMKRFNEALVSYDRAMARPDGVGRQRTFRASAPSSVIISLRLSEQTQRGIPRAIVTIEQPAPSVFANIKRELRTLLDTKGS